MSSAWAITMMRDEEDVAGYVLRHMVSEGFDGIIVADNMSTDETRAQLEAVAREASCRVIIQDDPVVGYFQSAKMTKLARQAAELGATHIVPFDADEIWYHPTQRIGDFLRGLAPHIGFAPAQLTNHFPSAQDTESPNPFESIVWRDKVPASLPKIAFRYDPDAVIEQGNHVVHLGRGQPADALWELQIRHFPYRSEEQFVRKARNGKQAYDAAPSLPQEMGSHWRSYGGVVETHGARAAADHFKAHFWYADPAARGLVRDPAPFQRWK